MQDVSQELNLDKDDVHKMTAQLRQGIVDNQLEVQLSGEVECDEVYITAGHKGNPEAVRKKGALGDVTASSGFGVAAHLKKKNHQSSA